MAKRLPHEEPFRQLVLLRLLAPKSKPHLDPKVEVVVGVTPPIWLTIPQALEVFPTVQWALPLRARVAASEAGFAALHDSAKESKDLLDEAVPAVGLGL